LPFRVTTVVRSRNKEGPPAAQARTAPARACGNPVALGGGASASRPDLLAAPGPVRDGRPLGLGLPAAARRRVAVRRRPRHLRPELGGVADARRRPRPGLAGNAGGASPRCRVGLAPRPRLVGVLREDRHAAGGL